MFYIHVFCKVVRPGARLSLGSVHNVRTPLQPPLPVSPQLQVRQEKALHRYDDTESEISQLLTRHSNETTSLRERLRRAQERERASERRLKDAEERLQRSQAAEARLRRLAEKQELGPREDLSRQLEQEKTLGQEAQRRVKVIYSITVAKGPLDLYSIHGSR